MPGPGAPVYLCHGIVRRGTAAPPDSTRGTTLQHYSTSGVPTKSFLTLVNEGQEELGDAEGEREAIGVSPHTPLGGWGERPSNCGG